jgi:hypothetical protein
VTGFFRRAARTEPDVATRPEPAAADLVATSKVFPKFLAAITQQPAPVLLDLGPVVGSNISFFGDRLGCKIYIEDLVADIEGHARRGERERLPQFLSGRLTQEPESVDGILCWDLFDFLDKAAGQTLAAKLARLLRTGGALYGFFGTTAIDLTSYSRYAIEADGRLRVRAMPATTVRRSVLVTRDINKMFDGLTVAESVLLKSNTRETLFRKT